MQPHGCLGIFWGRTMQSQYEQYADDFPAGGARNKKLLIVGCGMATARLLQELVRLGSDHRIEVIGEEPSPGYNRILLSSLLAGEHDEDELPLLARGWYAQHGIALRTGERVCAVDTVRRTVLTSSGRISHWDQLIFATGSLPNWPYIPGLDTGNVLGFRSLQDLEQIRAIVQPGQPALVLGGGLLGLEAASGMNGLGLDVTVLQRQEWLMNRQLDRPAAAVLQRALEQRGIKFRLGATPAQVHSQGGNIRGITLDDGSRLPATLLLLAIGVSPNITVAQAAGLSCDQGILVDGRLRTSQPGIYALGECCQLGAAVFGLVAPVYAQAAVLAAHLCGDPHASYCPADDPVQLKIAGIHVETAGGQLPDSEGECQILSDPARGIYRRLNFRDGRLDGYLLVGDKSGAASYRVQLQTAQTLDDSRPWLMFAPGALPVQPVLAAPIPPPFPTPTKELSHAGH